MCIIYSVFVATHSPQTLRKNKDNWCLKQKICNNEILASFMNFYYSTYSSRRSRLNQNKSEAWMSSKNAYNVVKAKYATTLLLRYQALGSTVNQRIQKYNSRHN